MFELNLTIFDFAKNKTYSVVGFGVKDLVLNTFQDIPEKYLKLSPPACEKEVNMKKIVKIVGLMLVLSLILILCGRSKKSGSSQKASASQKIDYGSFSKAQVVADIDFMVKTLESVHPDIYAEYPEKDFKRDIQKIKEQIKEPINRKNLFLLLSPVVAKLGDGHTFVGSWYFLDTIKRTKIPLFPFDIEFIEDQMVVKQNYSERKIEKGDVIIAVNNISSDKLISRMAKYVSGERDYYRKTILSYNFAAFLNLIMGWKENFTLKIQRGDKIINFEVKGILYDSMRKRRERGKKIFDYYEIKNLNTAVMTFNNFGNYQIKFDDYLKECFAKIRNNKIENLIIDLRNNGGGNSSLGDNLLAMITVKPFIQFTKVGMKISPEIKKRDNGRLTFIGKEEGTITHWKIDPKHHELDSELEDLRFKGKVYLLTGKYTFSSAASFAAAFKDSQMGEIVGEETGGLRKCFGDVYRFKLPETGIKMGVSFKYFVSGKNPQKGRGIIPHHTVFQKKEDIEKGVDTQLEFVRKLIEKSVES